MPDQTPPRRILRPEQIDHVADAVLTLARELWVVRDRQIILEQVLAERGVDVAAAVSAYQPDATLQARIDAERDRLVDRLAAALSGDA